MSFLIIWKLNFDVTPGGGALINEKKIKYHENYTQIIHGTYTEAGKNKLLEVSIYSLAISV